MPYKSKAQMRYMHAVHPGIAKRWDSKYGTPENLPEKKEYGDNVKKAMKKRS